MKTLWKRYVKICVAVVILVLLTQAALLPLSAVEPFYEFGEEYCGTPYDDALRAYTPTGDMRYDVLAIAFTQLGYHEGDSDADMHGENTAGSRNFVEYNRMYGKLDNGEGNGMSYGYSWCAAFVSWCLRHAGVPEEIAVTEVSCRRMTDWYRENATYYDRESGYTPHPGDVIMFHSGNGNASHVGFVIGVEKGRVHVIDGNSRKEAVATHTYHKNDTKILGYCVPAYTVLEGTVYDFPMEPPVADGYIAAVTVAVTAIFLAVIALLVLVAVRLRRQRAAEVSHPMPKG